MWEIAKGILKLLDGFFNIINDIWRYNFFDNEYVNRIFNGAIIVACSWLVLKVLLELIMNYIIKDDARTSPLSVYKGIVIAIAMMFLITPLFQFGHDFSTALTDSVIEVSGMGNKETETIISNALIRSMVYEDEMSSEDIDNLVNNWRTIDINATKDDIAGVGGYYLYSVNLFILIVLSVLTVFLLFFIAIQMAKRVMEIALFKIIAPFCCTSFTNHQSKSFETWLKSTMGLFLITVVQFVSLGLLINMFGNAIKDNGILTGIFLLIGALLFIISTPTIVSSLLGQQSGIMTGFGDLQSLTALSSGVNTGLGIAKSGVEFGLGMGSKAYNFGAKGINALNNLFSRNKNNNNDIDSIKDNINKGNIHKAYNQSRPESNNSNNNFNNSSNNNNYYNYEKRKNDFQNAYANNMRFQNQYKSQFGTENNNFKRRT